MWWHLDNNGVSWSWLYNFAHGEVSVVPGQVVVLGELVYTKDGESTSVGNQFLVRMDFITCQISVTNELLSWLINAERFWQLLSSQVDGEGITAVIWEVTFTDLDGIISKEVLPNELEVVTSSEESQHFPVVVQELFL